MNGLEKHAELIERINAAFNAAERQMKDVETRFPSDGLVIPTINELRYVGRHLISALRTADEQQQLEQLHEALSHCRRAAFDAAEVGILGYLEIARKFKEDHHDVVIAEAFPEWVQCATRIEAIRSEVVNIDRAQADAALERFQSFLNEAGEIVAQFDAARDELKKVKNSKAAAALREQTNQGTLRSRFKIQITLAVIAAMIGTAGAMFAYLKYA